MLCLPLRRYLCVFAVLLFSYGHADGVVLDWDSVTWNNGDMSNSYDVDPGVAGNDVTVSVTTNNGAVLQPYVASPFPQTPAVNAVFQGGLATIENTLTLAVDLDDPLQSITLTVSFSATGGATDVSFTIFDLDAGGGSQDQLSLIRGLSIDGSTLIAPIITTSADNTLIGTGIDQSVLGTGNTPSTGATSGRANVMISFGTTAIQSFTFTYGSTNAFSNPAYQHFGLHDLSFTPVPEINPTLMSIFSCLAAAGIVLRHRAKFRK